VSTSRPAKALPPNSRRPAAAKGGGRKGKRGVGGKERDPALSFTYGNVRGRGAGGMGRKNLRLLLLTPGRPRRHGAAPKKRKDSRRGKNARIERRLHSGYLDKCAADSTRARGGEKTPRSGWSARGLGASRLFCPRRHARPRKGKKREEKKEGFHALRHSNPRELHRRALEIVAAHGQKRGKKRRGSSRGAGLRLMPSNIPGFVPEYIGRCVGKGGGRKGKGETSTPPPRRPWRRFPHDYPLARC